MIRPFDTAVYRKRRSGVSTDTGPSQPDAAASFMEVWLPISRQHPIARSQAATAFCLRTKGGKKRFYPAYVLAASEICLAANFDAAAWGKPKSPGWPASGISARSPRDIYGTFCPGPIYPSKAGRRRNVIGQLAAPTQSRRPESAGLWACTGLQLSAEGAACRTR